MKKASTKSASNKTDMKVEYDFSKMKGSVRGKYYKAYREGHQVVLHNKALRSLIAIIPSKRRTISHTK